MIWNYMLCFVFIVVLIVEVVFILKRNRKIVMKGKDDFFTFTLIVLFALMIFPLSDMGSVVENIRNILIPVSYTHLLSGGNQQKVVIAKWLFSGADILIFDEPTRGIDVGAKYEIYMVMNELAAQGKAIIMISSDMNEVVAMSDRVIVMHDGEIRGELEGAEINPEAVLKYAIE